MKESGKVIDWLLEDCNPAVRYRTLRDLLGCKETDAVCRTAKDNISEWEPVKRIFSQMHRDGYWAAKGKSKIYGAGLDYKGYVTTPHVLHNLAELGLDHTHPAVEKAAKRFLRVLREQHGFDTVQSCVDGFMLRALWMLGYGQHPAVRKMIGLVKGSIRWDNGYLCDNKSGKAKSCMRGSWQVLMAFSEIPELAFSPQSSRLVEYFIKRNVLYRCDDPTQFLRPEVTWTVFPFVHGRASLLEPLYALSKLGYGKHPATESAWEILERHRTEDGKYFLDWAPATLFPVGKRGQADKWVTLYALLAKKYAGEKRNNRGVSSLKGWARQ